MTTLAIDTSNELLGVALEKDGQLIGETMTHIKEGQTARLMPAIVSLMEETRLQPTDLQRIVVAQGPGSYTGVRVGVTTAKTMAWGLDIPIEPVSSLEALAYNGQLFDGFVMPFFNARREAMYTGLYRFEAGILKEVLPERYVAFTDWVQQLEATIEPEAEILCLSPHVDVFTNLLTEALGPRAVIPEEAHHLLRPAHLLAASSRASTEAVHLVKPNYLRKTEAETNLLRRQKSE